MLLVEDELAYFEYLSFHFFQLLMLRLAAVFSAERLLFYLAVDRVDENLGVVDHQIVLLEQVLVVLL